MGGIFFAIIFSLRNHVRTLQAKVKCMLYCIGLYDRVTCVSRYKYYRYSIPVIHITTCNKIQDPAQYTCNHNMRLGDLCAEVARMSATCTILILYTLCSRPVIRYANGVHLSAVFISIYFNYFHACLRLFINNTSTKKQI